MRPKNLFEESSEYKLFSHTNSFLREQGPVGEPDLAALGFLDD